MISSTFFSAKISFILKKNSAAINYMSADLQKYRALITELGDKAKLIAVSKSKPAEDITELYNSGQRDFGENYVQELVDKYDALPRDINWHFIGHLQSNKVKNIAPFVFLVHGVDSFSLLKEINKQGEKNGRVINCLLQVHISKDETKFGMNEEELDHVAGEVKNGPFGHINIRGLMGIASFTQEMDKVKSEFALLKNVFDKYAQHPTANFQLSTLSMGMSADYQLAIEEGSNMVRIGSLLFGARNYRKIIKKLRF